MLFPFTVAGAFLKMVGTIAIGVGLLNGAKAGSKASSSFRAEFIWVVFFAGDGGLGIAVAIYNRHVIRPQIEKMVSCSEQENILARINEADRPLPDIRMFLKSDGSRFLFGTVHNETGKNVEKLRLSIKTANWERVYDVNVSVENNATASFSVFVGEAVDVETFKALKE